MEALPSFPGVTGCDSSTVGLTESGVRSYLTQGRLPVPAALTSLPCADTALLSLSQQLQPYLQFPWRDNNLLSACRGSSNNWDVKLFLLIYRDGRKRRPSVLALSLPSRQAENYLAQTGFLTRNIPQNESKP